MSNPLKYSTSTPSNALRKGNVAVGVNGIEYGPTISTNWYSGVLPTSGNYVIYKTSATGDPDIFAPQSDDELYKFVIMQGGNSSNTTSVGAALAWIATQSDLLAVNNPFSNIVTDGLVLNVDANAVGSYPTTGTPWYDLSGDGNNGTLTNGPTFNTNGWFDFDGVDDYVTSPNNVLAIPQSFTLVETSKGLLNSQNAGQNVYGTGWSSRVAFRHSTGNNPITGLLVIRADNSTSVQVANGTNHLDGKWHQLVATLDGDVSPEVLKIYLDGKLEVQGTIPDHSTQSPPVILGAWSGGYGFFNGSQGSAKIYNKALSESEVLQNYYQAPIVTDGLVFAVDAGNLVSYENGSATTYSLTGSVSGTLTNGVGFDSANGGGWVFDGTDDYIDLGNLGLIQTDFAISLWYENDSTKENFYFSTGYSNGGSILIFSDGVWINAAEVNGRLPGAPGRSIEGPTNIILTRTNGVAKWYKNGVEQGSLTYSGNITTGTNYTIGYALPRNKTTAYLEGKFYTLNIYNKGLTVAEVAQNYNSQKSRFTP